MKYIEYPSLNHLSRTLTHSSAECTVHTRIEAYSCKPINKDKKLQRAIEQNYAEEAAYVHSMSPPGSSPVDFMSIPLDSPFGPLDKHESRKTLYLLIATLNVAFPDYDFSDVRPSHFRKEQSGAPVLNSLSTTLLSSRDRPSSPGEYSSRSYSSFPPQSSDFFPSSFPTSSSPIQPLTNPPPALISGTHPTLYRILDDIITLSECEVFSYSPDMDSDPHAGDSDSDDTSSSSSVESDQFDFEDDEPDNGMDSYATRRQGSGDSAPWTHWSLEEDELTSSIDSLKPSQPNPVIRRHKGGLLWSSNWFFFHRKQKKILFISVWARKRIDAWAGGEDRFLAWEGAVGTGARAFGLKGDGAPF